MVCDKVVCEKWCGDKVVCGRWCGERWCVCVWKMCVWKMEGGRREAGSRWGGGPGYRIKNKNPTQSCGEQVFGAWKVVFLPSLSFLRIIAENNVSGPQVYPHSHFVWIGSSPNMREKKSELEKLFFCRALLQLSFLAIPANFVVDCLIFGRAGKNRIAQSAARRARAPRSRVRFRAWLFSPSYWVNNFPGPIGSSPSMREKKKRSLKNWFSAKFQSSWSC